MKRSYHLILTSSFAIVAVLLMASIASAQAGWTSRASMPIARRDFCAATGGDGKIYVMGGADSHDSFLSRVDVYDPPTNTWASAPDMPTSRANMAVVTGPDGLIYAIGGNTQTGQVLKTVEVFDPTTQKWTTGTPLPEERTYILNAAAVGSDGRIYVVGGSNDGSHLNRSDSVLACDLKAKTWVTRQSAPYTDYPAEITAGPDGRIYAVFTTIFSSGADYFAAYDPATDTWTPLANVPTPRASLALTTGLDGRIYAMGGATLGVANTGHVYDVVEVYDPVTAQWTTAEPLPIARIPCAATSAIDGRLFILGNGTSDLVDAYHLAPAGLFPDHGGNTGKVTVTIIERGVHEGATVKLVADGQQDIIGQNTHLLTATNFLNALHLQTTFDLNGVTLGEYRVLTTNPDGTVMTLPLQFRVEAGTQAQLWLDILGRTQVRPGSKTARSILFGNRGNVDFFDAILDVSFPLNIEFGFGDKHPTPNELNLPWISSDNFNSTPIGVRLGNSIAVPTWIYTLPANSNYVQPMQVTIGGQPSPHSIVDLASVILAPITESNYSRTGAWTDISSSSAFDTLLQASVQAANAEQNPNEIRDLQNQLQGFLTSWFPWAHEVSGQ